MVNATRKRRPTNRLPPLQRPTPSRCIRLHLDTHDQLSELKPPGMSFDEAVVILMRFMRGRVLGDITEEELQ